MFLKFLQILIYCRVLELRQRLDNSLYLIFGHLRLFDQCLHLSTSGISKKARKYLHTHIKPETAKDGMAKHVSTYIHTYNQRPLKMEWWSLFKSFNAEVNQLNRNVKNGRTDRRTKLICIPKLLHIQKSEV